MSFFLGQNILKHFHECQKALKLLSIVLIDLGRPLNFELFMLVKEISKYVNQAFSITELDGYAC
jgi:hypothetical protein